MTQITASLVKELRERTGAPMMDCKRALTETAGDIDAAIELMRKSGQAKADKKAGRVAAEGVVAVITSDDNKAAVMLEINSETDFVARDSNFIDFVGKVSTAALSSKADTVDALNATEIAAGETVEQARAALVAKIGENIQVRRLTSKSTSGVLGSYVHGGRIGVLVDLEGGDEALAKDIAMHVAASQPEVVSPDDVPAELIAKEKEIFAAQAKESGKPDNIIEKMVEGRVKKFLNEVSLVGQPFVKDPNKTVGKLLEESKAKVISFTRYVVGEGIEKEEVDFAQEVMSQLQ